MSWDNIVGHESIVQLLQGQLAKKRLAQSYLFVGLGGIGKRALALELAKTLLCPSKHSVQACDRCESCQKIPQGFYPDLLIMGPESETAQIGIDQVRTLTNWASLTPYAGVYKVALLEGADHLTEEAAHACLKLLEEPPENSCLILTASSVTRLPRTLVSRCYVVRCAPQGIHKVASFLKEKEKLDFAQAQRLAVLSGGRIGIALKLKAEGWSAKKAALEELLAARRQKIVEVPLGDAPRLELEEALEWFASWWRDLLVLKLGGRENLLIHQEYLAQLQQVSREPLTLEVLLRQVDRTLKAHEAIQRNASPRIALAALLSG